MHTELNYTCQSSHDQEDQIVNKYYTVILLIGFTLIMEDGLLNHLLIHKASNLSLILLKQFGISICVIMRNSKNMVITYLSFSINFSAVLIQSHTSNRKNPLMQMISICIAKFLLHMLRHREC